MECLLLSHMDSILTNPYDINITFLSPTKDLIINTTSCWLVSHVADHALSHPYAINPVAISGDDLLTRP